MSEYKRIRRETAEQHVKEKLILIPVFLLGAAALIIGLALAATIIFAIIGVPLLAFGICVCSGVLDPQSYEDYMKGV